MNLSSFHVQTQLQQQQWLPPIISCQNYIPVTNQVLVRELYNQEYQQIMQLLIVQYMQIGIIIQALFKKAVATGPRVVND